MATKRNRSFDEVSIWSRLTTPLQQWSEIGQKLFVGEPREPRIVQHDQVISARVGFEIYQFFLKKICIRKLGDIYVNAGLCLVVDSGRFKSLALNSADYGECELFAVWLLARGTASEK